MFRKFVNWNVAISHRIDQLFYKGNGRFLLENFLDRLDPVDRVADVGGGKKPVLGIIVDGNFPVSAYDGFDIDADELEQARHLYTNVHVIDLTKSVDEHRGKYSKILCKSTLEHVLDDHSAFKSLSDMLETDGELYVKVPCKYAMFARLNLLLPNELKRRVLHFIFPVKVGDGFPAYYKGCSVSEMEQNAINCGMTMVATNKNMKSTYFMFFIPLYVLWRLITLVQILVNKDYCENFEAVFKKQKNSERS